MLVWQTRASPFAITVLDRPSGGARPQTAAPTVLAAGSICDAARQYGLFQTPLTVAGLQIQRQQVVIVDSFFIAVRTLSIHDILSHAFIECLHFHMYNIIILISSLRCMDLIFGVTFLFL